ncbi:hypothetical protein Tco_0798363 [Tanacetum coccineum]
MRSSSPAILPITKSNQRRSMRWVSLSPSGVVILGAAWGIYITRSCCYNATYGVVAISELVYYSSPSFRDFAARTARRAKVTTIEQSKDLTSLSLNELIGNIKVHEMIIKKDSEIVKAKGEIKSLALKAKKESSDEESLTSGSSWSDSGEEENKKIKDKTCLVDHASNEVRSDSSYFSDENSSIDDFILDSEYDKLCKMSLKIITKNKRLKAIRNILENELSELKEKLSTVKKNKGVDLECTKYQLLSIENEKLKEEAIKLTKFEKSTHCLNEMLSNQKPSGDKLGLGFNSFEASSSGTKEIKFVKSHKDTSPGGGPLNKGGPHIICLGVDLEPEEWIKDSGCSKHTTENQKFFSTYKAYNRGNVIFDSNLRGNISVKAAISHGSLKISNVEHVDNLGFNLLSVGQICDSNCKVIFSENDSETFKDGKVIETKNVNEALKDESWIIAMQEELNQFIANDVWELVPQPKNMTIIGTKWVFRNKLDENGVHSRNKARFVGCYLTSWFSKKQTDLAISTTEYEYISTGKACQQALWMKHALIDYDIRLDDVPIMCDNKGAIDLSKNLVQHSRTKNIEIRHHSLCDNVQKGHISIEKVSYEDNIVDILTKPLKRESFNYLCLGLGMMEHIP